MLRFITPVDYRSPDAPRLFSESLHRTGFGVLTHHPLSQDRLERIYGEWLEFFHTEARHKYAYDPKTMDGYFSPAISETAKGHSKRDLKEYYHIYPWGRYPSEVSDAARRYYDEGSKFAAELLRWVEEHSPAAVKAKYSMPLPKMIEGSEQTLLRVLHYPPLSGQEEPGALRAAAHGDINLLTILPAATQAGLQVLGKDGAWHDVPCDFGMLIVNIGDSSTQLALRHARNAVNAGAEALALTPPHYYPHSMDETLIHFRAFKEAFPSQHLFVYNIPQTVKVKMSLQTTLQLAREGTVQGIKDSQNDLRWFRNLAHTIREDAMEARFRMFLGTRILVDAARVIGAHGAIPATSNVAPAAAAETWEAAIRGDFNLAARAQEVVMGYEDLAEIARGGSTDAAGYSSMKNILKEWGVLQSARLTRPLRKFTSAEIEALREGLRGLPHGSQRVAVTA